jgi:NADP-dependent 3-hydroxy acid dehydrogenase YdfG
MLNDTVAVALGGDTGIGKAIGVQLAKNGSKVALASRNPAHLESAAAELRALGLSILRLQMDVRSKHAGA